jgi:DNA polymerase III subunit delta'
VTLYGCDRQIGIFRAALRADRLHHAWLVAGPRGVGKARFADWAARLLLDAEGDGAPGASLLDAGSHPDFKRLERLANDKTGNLARNITVDQVRQLRSLFATGTAISGRRVVLIDSIDDLERGAANALLKSLEEPPTNTIFLLVSHQPGRLLATIRSRCRTLMFGPLDDEAMTSFLSEALPDIDRSERLALVGQAKGLPSAALAYAALDFQSIEGALEELATSGDRSNTVRSALARSLALKAASARYEAFLARAPAFIADYARNAQVGQLDTALTAWRKARALSEIAIPRSLVPETVVFEMAGLVASLAPAERAAKA